MDTHDIVAAQYDESGDDERFVCIYRIGDANIAISPEESDADQGTFRWNQPCEARRVPMKRVIELNRWLPVASDPFTATVAIPRMTETCSSSRRNRSESIAGGTQFHWAGNSSLP